MKVRVSGKQIGIGAALPAKVRKQVTEAVGKHFDGGAESSVVFSHEGFGYRVDCTTHLDSGTVLKSEGIAADAHHAFDAAVDHMKKQIRRYKRRLKNHHDKSRVQGAASG
ncbi:MAG TPA: ribosome-associated translation inhibitor RaiA [Rhizomicrobium sp.]|jgi:ribosomal subunit interface protein